MDDFWVYVGMLWPDFAVPFFCFLLALIFGGFSVWKTTKSSPVWPWKNPKLYWKRTDFIYYLVGGIGATAAVLNFVVSSWESERVSVETNIDTIYTALFIDSTQCGDTLSIINRLAEAQQKIASQDIVSQENKTQENKSDLSEQAVSSFPFESQNQPLHTSVQTPKVNVGDLLDEIKKFKEIMINFLPEGVFDETIKRCEDTVALVNLKYESLDPELDNLGRYGGNIYLGKDSNKKYYASVDAYMKSVGEKRDANMPSSFLSSVKTIDELRKRWISLKEDHGALGWFASSAAQIVAFSMLAFAIGIRLSRVCWELKLIKSPGLAEKAAEAAQKAAQKAAQEAS